MAMFIPLAVALGPELIKLAMQIYRTAAGDPETPESKRAEYARIADALEIANDIVQAAPLPPPGSGR
ncbi:MAG TPA: hypothetical protein VKA83_01500 [Methylomirabilota bacterium]|nr:hypothetical protein [Methylomirabilota bacterium]